MRVFFNLLIVTVITYSFTSCSSGKYMDKQLVKQFSSLPKINNAKNGKNIVINSPLLVKSDTISTSISKFHSFIPLIIFWHYESDTYTTLNAQIPIAKFVSTIQTQQNLQRINEKLNGRKLELSIDTIPQNFYRYYNYNLVFLLIYFQWYSSGYKGLESNMVVSYKVTGLNNEVKKGAIHVPYNVDQIKDGLFKSWTKGLSKYLEKYEDNISNMTNEFVEQLLREL